MSGLFSMSFQTTAFRFQLFGMACFFNVPGWRDETVKKCIRKFKVKKLSAKHMTFVFKAYMFCHQKSWLNISKHLCFLERITTRRQTNNYRLANGCLSVGIKIRNAAPFSWIPYFSRIIYSWSLKDKVWIVSLPDKKSLFSGKSQPFIHREIDGAIYE